MGQRVGDLVGDPEHLAHGMASGRAPTWVTASAATATAYRAASMGLAPRRYEEQNAAARASPAPVASISSTGGEAMNSPSTVHPEAPSFTTGIAANRSSRMPSASASVRVAKSRSGARSLRTWAIRAGPYSWIPAADERSLARRPPPLRTNEVAAPPTSPSGSSDREYACAWIQ